MSFNFHHLTFNEGLLKDVNDAASEITKYSKDVLNSLKQDEKHFEEIRKRIRAKYK